MDNIDAFIGEINSEDKVEFTLDFLIAEVESDKLVYKEISNAIHKIKSFIQDGKIQKTDLLCALYSDCSNKMNLLYSNIQKTMEISDLVAEKYADLDNIRVQSKIRELYSLNAEILKLCLKCKAEMQNLE